jgi:hypothetical protein
LTVTAVDVEERLFGELLRFEVEPEEFVSADEEEEEDADAEADVEEEDEEEALFFTQMEGEPEQVKPGSSVMATAPPSSASRRPPITRIASPCRPANQDSPSPSQQTSSRRARTSLESPRRCDR